MKLYTPPEKDIQIPKDLNGFVRVVCKVEFLPFAPPISIEEKIRLEALNNRFDIIGDRFAKEIEKRIQEEMKGSL